MGRCLKLLEKHGFEEIDSFEGDIGLWVSRKMDLHYLLLERVETFSPYGKGEEMICHLPLTIFGDNKINQAECNTKVISMVRDFLANDPERRFVEPRDYNWKQFEFFLMSLF